MLNQKNDVICMGQLLMDCIVKGWKDPAADSHIQMAESITLSPGGDAYNESVILSRLGYRVQTLCGLGNDLAGNILKEKLRENGIDVQKIVLDDKGETPVSTLLIDKHGERKSVNAKAHLLPFYHLEKEELEQAKIVSLASLFRAPLNNPESILKICKEAKEHGAMISADVKLPNATVFGLEDIRESLPYIDYIFPNEAEARYYSGEQEYAKMADVFLEYGVKTVIIKLGKQGCFVKNKNEEFYYPAYEVETVDGTGAGDNFVAGFLSSVLRGSDLKSAVAFGTACAAICVQHIGATTGVQSLEQVETIIREMRSK